MRILLYAFICFLYAIILSSCPSQKTAVFVPVPEKEYFEQEQKNIVIDNILETKDGSRSLDGFSAENLPPWLSAYLNGGIAEVERINFYNGKYVFIAFNEGIYFTSMNIWANNFSAVQDFTMLVADRIERRMISSATLYPDYEYGLFFETMIKKAYSTVYSGAVKEDTYWIKLKVDNEDDGVETGNTEVYNFFVLFSIDRVPMRAVIVNMMAESFAAVTPTDAQRNAIIRLQQRFFDGF
jgi:hypothetical protein